MQDHTEAMKTGTAPPATVQTWNTLFFLRCKLDRRAELDQEWADTDGDRREFHWRR